MATVADNVNPNIQYVGSTWLTDHKEDNQMNKYSNSSSTKDGDYALIKWHGKDIAIYGARRDNHGIYGVAVDGGDPQYYSGFAQPDSFQQVLYATSGLPEGDHQLKVSNENQRNIQQYPNYIWFDLDYIAFTGTLINANTAVGGAQPTSSSQVNAAPAPTSSSSSSSISSAADSNISSSSSSASSGASSSADVSTSRSKTGTGTIASATAGPAVKTFSGSQTISVTSTLSNTAMTTGTPATTGGGSPNQAAGAAEGSEGTSSNSKTTVIAVSATVIGLAVLVIATVGTLVFLRRRRHRQEMLQEDEGDYVVPQSSWRQL